MSELTATQIRELVGNRPVMLEIGCNGGEDTKLFLDAMTGATLYCFEPDPRAIARFNQRIHSDRVVLIEAAVSDTDGHSPFHGSSGVAPRSMVPKPVPECHLLQEWDLSGSLCKPTGHLSYSPWVKFTKENEYIVRTVRLDTWLDEHFDMRVIDFAWVDSQGAEAMIFRGGQNFLRHTRYCYFEFYDKPLYEGQLPLNELLELLPGGKTQWKLLGIYGDNALVENQTVEYFDVP